MCQVPCQLRVMRYISQSSGKIPDGDITLIILFWRKNERFRDVR